METRHFYLSILIALLFALAPRSLSQTSEWTSNGPGAIVGLAIDPTNSQVMISGCTTSGVYKSTDGGLHWTFHGDGLQLAIYGEGMLPSININTVVIDPLNPDIVFAGTGVVDQGIGLFKSTDGGVSWRVINSGLPRATICDVAINWADDRIVFASAGYTWNMSNGQLYRSTDRGESWTQVIYFKGPAGPVMVDPSNPNTVYACDGAGSFYVSLDAGASWIEHANNVSIGPLRRMVKRPDGTFMVTSFYGGIYGVKNDYTIIRFRNGLDTNYTSWAKYWEITQDSLNVYVAAGDSGIYKSSDEGRSWYNIFPYHTESVRKVGQEFFAGTESGLYKSTDQGVTWSLVSCDIGSGETWSLAIARSDPRNVFVLTLRGVFKSVDAGNHWSPITIVGVTYFTALAVDPADPDVVYATAGGFFSFDTGVFKSTDGGKTWANKSPQAGVPVTAIDIRPDSSNVIFVGSPGAVWRSTDRGDTWTPVLIRYGPSETWVVKIAPSNPRVIYAGVTADAPERAGIWVSEDNGETWELRVNGLPDGIGARNVLSIDVDPVHADTAYAGSIQTGIWKTTDCGRTWVQSSDGLFSYNSGRVVSLMIDRDNPSKILAAVGGSTMPDSLMGVYQSTNGGASWARLILPGVYRNGVTSIASGTLAGQRFTYVAAVGGGVFSHVSSTNGLSADQNAPPVAFLLSQNYPNPFNPTTTIQYALPHRSQVVLAVYNTLGQKVAALVNADMDPGYHSVQFDGSGLASGVYFYQLRAGSFVQTRKLLLTK